MAQQLKGHPLAKSIRARVASQLNQLPTQPILAVILVGQDPASHLYVNLKRQACEEVGIGFELFFYQEDVSTDVLKEAIQDLNVCEDVTGILVQLPLPNQKTDEIIAQIDPQKDVDGFHPENLRALQEGKDNLAPAVALGIIELIKRTEEPLNGKQAVIVSSQIFGRPLLPLLKKMGCQATIVSPKDPELERKTLTADILISAVGKAGMITGAMVKTHAMVIDVGTTRTDQGTLGDVDWKSVDPIASWITPVPGGVGPMTVAMLLENVLKAYRIQN